MKKEKISESVALIILNQPLNIHYLDLFFDQAKTVFLADGGSNRLYDVCAAKGKPDMYLPHYVIGDLDSIRNDV